MSLDLAPTPPPLLRDTDGVIRIGSTRVTLDTVWAAFETGASAEEIADRYPSLDLAEVYQVIGYGLGHPTDLGKYLAERSEQRRSVRESNEARCEPAGLRKKLVRRREQSGA